MKRVTGPARKVSHPRFVPLSWHWYLFRYEWTCLHRFLSPRFEAFVSLNQISLWLRKTIEPHEANEEAFALIGQLAEACTQAAAFSSFSTTIYDTAWAAMVSKDFHGKKQWLFPQCFEYLLAHQMDEGGWDLICLRSGRDPQYHRGAPSIEVTCRYTAVTPWLRCSLYRIPASTQLRYSRLLASFATYGTTEMLQINGHVFDD